MGKCSTDRCAVSGQQQQQHNCAVSGQQQQQHNCTVSGRAAAATQLYCQRAGSSSNTTVLACLCIYRP